MGKVTFSAIGECYKVRLEYSCKIPDWDLFSELRQLF